MLIPFGLSPLTLLAHTAAVVNQPCVGKHGRAGVCLKTSDCTKDGGELFSRSCVKDGTDVRCCTKPTCGDSSKRDLIMAGGNSRPVERAAFSGNCRGDSDCAGKTQGNLCPGPSEFKCCDSDKEGFGGHKKPNDNWKGGCKDKAIKGAERILKTFPGRVRALGCLRAPIQGKDSDHYTGMATDLMCSDGDAQPTMSGKEIAEWVMKHREELNLKYVIWGQRIWSTEYKPADKPGPWEDWRVQKSEGSINENHWNHVHVSYK